ncbi:hypothetical protein ACF08M_34815 [Streptomyces sp. NPDC015032]|uniref:hypothetical protein n=1 Tax=Streptomyces sp. NPDC015032 TaxID=3364937 RepID=UPI0036FA42AA
MGTPTVAANGVFRDKQVSSDGHLEVFVVGEDGSMWHSWEDVFKNTNTWGSWTGFDATDATSATVAAQQDGRLTVLAIIGGTVQHRWQNPGVFGWSGWTGFGSQPDELGQGRIAIEPNQDGRLEAFLVAQGNLWHSWQKDPNGDWNPDWVAIDNPFLVELGGTPAVAANQDGTLEAFVTASNGSLWHTYQGRPNNGWSSLEKLVGDPPADPFPFLGSSPTAAANLDGRLEVLVIGGDGKLWRNYQGLPNSGWSNWSSFDSPPHLQDSQDPIATCNEDGHLEVFATGSQILQHLWQTSPSNGWVDKWYPFAGEFSQSTAAVARNLDDELVVFVIGQGANLLRIAQTEQNNGWGGWNDMGRPSK